MSQHFAYLPMQAFQDQRLGLIDVRVLASIWSFGANPGDTVWPSRELIRQRIGNLYCDAVISRSISRLVKAGYLLRTQTRQGPNKYVLQVPTMTDSVTVTESVTVTDSVRLTVTDSVRLTVTDSDDIEETKEETKKKPTIVGDARASHTENKQPSGASGGGDGPHNGEPAKQDKRKPSTKVPMTDDWVPDADLWDDIAKLAIDQGFAESLLPEFRRYWREDRAGEKRPGWNRTFLAHAQRNWKREQEKPLGGTNVTPLRQGAVFNGPANFRTFGELRAERNIQLAKEWVNETAERCIND